MKPLSSAKPSLNNWEEATVAAQTINATRLVIIWQAKVHNIKS